MRDYRLFKRWFQFLDSLFASLVLNKPATSSYNKTKKRKNDMQITKPLVLSVLAAVLLSSSFFSLAAADDSTPDSIPPSPLLASDETPEEPTTDPNDNSTRTQDDNQTYHILDDQAPLIAPAAPGEERENGLAAETSSDNSVVAIAVGVVLAVVVGGVVGLVLYRKQTKKAEN
jgi:flagellar basal body-associated protein FliL